MTTATPRQQIGLALAELIEQAKSGGTLTRVGLMAHGSEHGQDVFFTAITQALHKDSCLHITAFAPKETSNDGQRPEHVRLVWQDTDPSDAAMGCAMEKALATGSIEGAVALHYPFPLGVTTIGRVLTPATGKPMLIASCTGGSATQRQEALVRNALYGQAVAKATGIANPSIALLNSDGATQALRLLQELIAKGYSMQFGKSQRADAGQLLRGNDLLTGAVDVCVCDTLTGNTLIKLFAAFTSGGTYESMGWGYGPSVGEGWKHTISIISRASGASVIANALSFTAEVIRGKVQEHVASELQSAKKAGLRDLLTALNTATPKAKLDVVAPPKEVVTEELHGIDVLDMEVAVQCLWEKGIYAESAMGCTGPVIKISQNNKEIASKHLQEAKYL